MQKSVSSGSAGPKARKTPNPKKKAGKPESANAESTSKLAAVIKALAAEQEGKPGALLSILEKLQDQDQFRHLSEEALRLVAEITGEALSRVYSVATFYSYFNLKPQGKHTITVCRGTACHTRGSLALLQEAMNQLGEPDFREDEEPSFTTSDKLFTVRTVACFGQCALAPVVAVDETIYSSISTTRLCSVINAIRKEEKV
ncbi:MAG: NAD(P)H-dependent oxidoreductase subunit E [Spirochaetes bacterium]|nr:NAD(P)H-dependent oxidoreductase subunit E [Spirochaetota bacterium]MBU0956521.1 NAD(P)H-dependent oxidoreductase subunit E [Spirochaetota bacterium]